MNHTKHRSNNHVFGAPQGWDQEALPCDALPVTIGDFGGQPSISSFWKPTEAELKMLNDGGMVLLHIIGLGMPPVALGVAPKEVNLQLVTSNQE